MSWWIWIPGGYVVGYAVAQRVMYANWRSNFGAEFEGFAWAMYGAIFWPIIGPMWLLWKVLG